MGGIKLFGAEIHPEPRRLHCPLPARPAPFTLLNHQSAGGGGHWVRPSVLGWWDRVALGGRVGARCMLHGNPISLPPAPSFSPVGSFFPFPENPAPGFRGGASPHLAKLSLSAPLRLREPASRLRPSPTPGPDAQRELFGAPWLRCSHDCVALQRKRTSSLKSG